MKTLGIAALTGIALAALVFLLYQKLVPQNKTQLYKVHYVAKAETGQQSPGGIEEIMAGIQGNIKRRFTALGYLSIIRRIGNDRLSILAQNVTDTLLSRQSITQNSKIEFRELYTLGDLPLLFATADNATTQLAHSLQIKDSVSPKWQLLFKGSPSIYSFLSPLVSDESEGKTVFHPAIGALNKKDTAILSLILRQPVVLQGLPADLEFQYGPLTDEHRMINTPDDLQLYAFRIRGEDAFLGNQDLKDSWIDMSYPQIILQFNRPGSIKWQRLIRQNTGHYLAILVDEQVISAYMVDDVIQKENSVIGGHLTQKLAEDLSRRLKTGLLPANLSIIEEKIYSQGWTEMSKKMALSLISFFVATCLGYFIINTLKNK